MTFQTIIHSSIYKKFKCYDEWFFGDTVFYFDKYLRERFPFILSADYISVENDIHGHRLFIFENESYYTWFILTQLD